MRAFIKKLIYIKKNQSGFSLVELMIAIAISSIIIVGLVMTIFQLYKGHAQTSGEMTVIRQVQNAGYWISRDAQMAKEVLVGDDPDTADYIEVVTLTWYWFTYHGEWVPPLPADRDGDGLRVIYTLEDGRLYRNYDVFSEDDIYEDDDPNFPTYGEVTFGDLPYDYKTFIAEYISNIEIVPMGNGLYSMTVTASVEGIAGKQEETRTYEAKPRPNVY